MQYRPKTLHIAASDISQGQNWCCVFKKVQYRPMSLHIAASDISQGQNCCCVFKKVQYRPKTLDIAASDISQGQNCCCVFKKVQYRPKTLHIAASDISQGQNCCCVFKKVQYRPKTLHIAASDISQGQNCCCVFKKVQYRPKTLHIAASDISQGQNWCCVFKKVQYRLCLCILLHLIYHKDKTGVVYSKRCNIAFVFAYCCIRCITRTKLVLCIQKGAKSPLSLHIAASDISQGQNWCCVFKKVQYRLCLCILLHPIYHKDKTGVVYSKRCNIAFVFAYCCIRYITRTKLVLCIQKGAISPLSLHIAASVMSEGQNWCCVSKRCNIALCLCILLHLLHHKDKIGVVYQKGAISPLSLHIAASDISQGQNWCCVFKKVQYRLCLCILLHPIYHKDKTGVVYSKRCNIALCLCILLHLICHKDKTGVVYSKRCNIAYASHIAASDISQGQNWCCVFKKVQYRLCLCILLHLIYHKDKIGVVYSKRCNIAFVFAYCCI